MHSPDIEVAAMPLANAQLADYGLAIVRFGNLDVSPDDDDSAQPGGLIWKGPVGPDVLPRCIGKAFLVHYGGPAAPGSPGGPPHADRRLRSPG